MVSIDELQVGATATMPSGCCRAESLSNARVDVDALADGFQGKLQRLLERRIPVIRQQGICRCKLQIGRAEARIEAEKRAQLEAPARAQKARTIVDAEAALWRDLHLEDRAPGVSPHEVYLERYGHWFGSPPELVDWHPNDRGHAVIAREILRHFRHVFSAMTANGGSGPESYTHHGERQTVAPKRLLDAVG